MIAPDLPGHGQSSPIVDSSIESIAGHIRAFIDHLDIKNFTLLGHSLGGYIALAFAHAYPDSISRLGLIHSTAFPDSDEAKANRDKAISSIQKEGMGSFIDGLVPKLFAESNKNSPYVDRAKEIGMQTDADSAIGMLHAMRDRKDRRDTLNQLSIPILLVAGKEDVVIPSEKTFTVSGTHVLQSLLSDTGHMSMYESPKQLAEQIDIFMNK